MSKVLEDNSGVVHTSMKRMTLFDLFEFFPEFTHKKPTCNEQCNGIDNQKNPFDTSPFLEHFDTSERGA